MRERERSVRGTWRPVMRATMATVCASTATGQDFARLYVDNLAFVQHVVHRYGVPIRDTADVAQDVFARVLEKIATYDTARPARPWLFVFAARFAMDYRTAGTRREEPYPSPPDTESGEASAEEMLVAHEQRDAIIAALDALDPHLREIGLRHDLHAVPMPEIARDLRLPLDTGYTRLRRARAALRKAL